ncbi:tetratricopeptide repeat protein [Rubrivirga sp. IMCC43871]|uniref:tetratricopeptide repeat protein n=1 Tax=Rubrivirga sp. IMCC43871 TaxID=3391575 RepID=UPI00398FCD40
MTPRLLRSASLALCLLAGPVFAQADGPEPLADPVRTALGIETDAGAMLYAQGLAASLDMRLDDARSSFRQLAAAEPESPAGVYGLESVALWQALVTEEDDAFDRFYALNDSLTAVVDGRDEAPGARVLGGAAKLHRALAFARQERYLRAGNSLREACGRFDDLSEHDALFGQGICEVAAGSIPRAYKFVARLLGFRGSVAGGLAKLDAASSADGLHALDAAVAFAISDSALNERRAGSVDRLAALAEAHPSSPVLGYLAGFHLLVDRRAAEAVVALRRAEAARDVDGVLPLPVIDAHLGMALFRQREFAAAAPLLEDFARTFRGRALLAQSTLHAGLAYEMLGDRRRAESLYRRVRAVRDYDADLSAEREAAHRLENPLTASSRALVIGGAAYDAGDYADAIAALQPVVTGAELPAVKRAEAAYRTGRALQATERWDDAIRHFQLAIDKPGDPLAKWGPWALYHQGEVHEAQGDLEAAERLYDRVLDNEEEFDFHKSLEQRARAAQERIRRRS